MSCTIDITPFNVVHDLLLCAFVCLLAFLKVLIILSSSQPRHGMRVRIICIGPLRSRTPIDGRDQLTDCIRFR